MTSLGSGARDFLDSARAFLRRDGWLAPGIMAENVKSCLINARTLLHPSDSLDDTISQACICASRLADELEAGKPRLVARDRARAEALQALEAVRVAATQAGPSSQAKALGVE